MKLLGHPSHHGHHVNRYTCSAGIHHTCSGFSEGYETYLCGCCCHDPEPELSDEDRVIVQRIKLKGEGTDGT